MTARIELAMVSPEMSFDGLAGNLAALPSLAGALEFLRPLATRGQRPGASADGAWRGKRRFRRRRAAHDATRSKPLSAGFRAGVGAVSEEKMRGRASASCARLGVRA